MMYVTDLKIPIDNNGYIHINYKAKQGNIKKISAFDIYSGNFKAQDIQDQVVLIGASSETLHRLKNVPFDERYPSAEIQATVIDNILNQRFLYTPSWSKFFDTFFLFIILLLLSFTRYINNNIRQVIFVSLIFLSILTTVSVFYFYGFIVAIFLPLMTFIVGFILLNVIDYLEEIKQSRKIKNKFAQKVSSAVMEDIISSDSNVLQAKESEVSIFFSDIRGFTTISEQMASPKDLICLLNDYMTPMVDIISKNQGTVDKFIGDAIMAYWNAPKTISNHADLAVSSAIDQIKALNELNKTFLLEGKPEIKIGIGINTGRVIVGEMGSTGRSDYTIIGDHVNLASRVEGLTKAYGAEIIITQTTKDQLTKNYEILDIDLVRVKGKNEPVKIYQVLGCEGETYLLHNETALYNEAIELYRDSKFEEAKSIFKSLNDLHSKTLLSLYIDRCDIYIKEPPKDFDGTFTFTTK